LAEVDLLSSGAGSGLDGRVEQVGGRRLRCRAGRHDGIGENRQHRALSLFVLAHQVYLQVGAVTVEDVLAGRVQMPLHQPVAIIADQQRSTAVGRLGDLDGVAGVFHYKEGPCIVDAQRRQLRPLRRRNRYR
jgi:hypothetical protein